jgi:hypothetical protein
MRRGVLMLVAGSIAAAVALELLLRLLPVPTSTRTGYSVDERILTYPPHHRWVSSTGWDLRAPQRQRSNNVGFLATRDFVPDARAVALIGDSYVEASMLDVSERLAAQLETTLGGRPVYAMGGPGSSLLDYAERIRFAADRLAVRDMVLVIERGDIAQSLCGSGNVHAACLAPDTLAPRTERYAPSSLAQRVLRESALAQYVAGQLRASPQRLWERFVATAAPVTEPHAAPAVAKVRAVAPAADPQLERVLDAFFERVRPYRSGRLILVLDSDRAALARGEASQVPALALLAQRAAREGAIVIDTAPAFAAHIAASSLKLEVSPQDAHWNALANGIVARLIAEGLR